MNGCKNSRNFGKRAVCYVCNAPKELCGVPTTAGGNHPAKGFAYDSPTYTFADPVSGAQQYAHYPTKTLVLRGLGPRVTQQELHAHFSALAPVHDCFVYPDVGEAVAALRRRAETSLAETLSDPVAMMEVYTKGGGIGLGFVTFSAPELATHALSMCRNFDTPSNRPSAEFAHMTSEHWLAAGIGYTTIDRFTCECTYARDDAIASAQRDTQLELTQALSVPANGPATTAASGAHQQQHQQVTAGAGQAAAARVPLPFEYYGQNYTFDPRTGFFYEPTMMFWYDTAAQKYLDAVYHLYFSIDTVGAGGGTVLTPWVPQPPPEDAARPDPAATGIASVLPSSGIGDPVSSNHKSQTAAATASVQEAAAPAHSKAETAVSQMMARWKKVKTDAQPASSARKISAVVSEVFEQDAAASPTNDSTQPQQRSAHNPVTDVGVSVAVAVAPALSTTAASSPTAAATGIAAQAAVERTSAELTSVSTGQSSTATAAAGPAIVNVPTVTGSAAAVAAVCNLCQRGFATAQQLEKHISKSELHRTNLLLLNKGEIVLPPGTGISRVTESAETNNSTAAIGYRDRAAERRDKYGALPAPSAADSDQATVEVVVPIRQMSAAETLGAAAPLDASSNVGASLLKKMGWKIGEGLGKDSQGTATPLDAVNQLGGTAGFDRSLSVRPQTRASVMSVDRAKRL
jgi:hypothetical protein